MTALRHSSKQLEVSDSEVPVGRPGLDPGTLGQKKCSKYCVGPVAFRESIVFKEARRCLSDWCGRNSTPK